MIGSQCLVETVHLALQNGQVVPGIGMFRPACHNRLIRGDGLGSLILAVQSRRLAHRLVGRIGRHRLGRRLIQGNFPIRRTIPVALSPRKYVELPWP